MIRTAGREAGSAVVDGGAAAALVADRQRPLPQHVAQLERPGWVVSEPDAQLAYLQVTPGDEHHGVAAALQHIKELADE